ncbi:MAG: YqaE/Pmp3 family membrane protein [Chitinophagaceae bacterium]
MRKLLLSALAFLVIGASFNSLPAASLLPSSSEPDPVAVKSAMAAFTNLSKKEKREKVREVRSEIKAFKAAQKAGSAPSTNTLLLVILAILLPPLAVYLHEGAINTRFWICLILTLLFFVPGVIYALIVVLGDK